MPTLRRKRFCRKQIIWLEDYIEKELGHLPAATKQKIICDNAAKLYRFVN